MLRRKLPLLRALLHRKATPPTLLTQAAASPIQPRRGLASWSPSATAPCPISGVCSPEACDSSSSSHQPFASTAVSASFGPQGILVPSYPRKILLPNDKDCYHLEYKDALDHFRGTPLLVKASDSNDGLHMLLTPDPDWPWLVTENGKFSLNSLKDLVVQAHREGWTLGKEQLSLENLIVSSIGTFKFKNPIVKYSLTDDNRIEDFDALSHVIILLVKLLHGDDTILPDDLQLMTEDLKTVTNPKIAALWIDYYPALLPVVSYGLAFLKFHGLFLQSGKGLLHTNSDAADVLQIVSYRTKGVSHDDWTLMAANDAWLPFWYGRIPGWYDVSIESHVLIFPRNVVAHCLDNRGKMPRNIQLSSTAIAQLLPGPGNPAVFPYYQPESVYVLLQYKFPRWLPQIMKGLVEYCEKKKMIDLFHSVRFGQLFNGVQGCFVK